MRVLPVFRCPICRGAYQGRDLQDHLASDVAHRDAVFALFVADHGDRVVVAQTCTGAREIVPLMDAEERGSFGIGAEACGEAVLGCGCGGSFCTTHTFACRSCGRFACLRHRWSGHCPDCARARTAKPVVVDKYDPFSKERSKMVRTYRQEGGVPMWPRLDADG